MKIARFRAPDGQVRIGAMIDERTARPLAGDLFNWRPTHEKPVEIAEFLPPVDPPNILAIGLNYRRHAEETNQPLPERPLIFLKATTAVVGHDAPIVLPRSAPAEVDYEAELAVIIGRRAKNVAAGDALEHVLGYTCANDVSARDCQKRIDKQWARGKSFDTFCPLGPWLVAAAGFDPDDRRIRSRLNGQVMQDSTTSDMIFSCRELISYLSHQFTLLPGTVILTGTPEGVGTVRKPPVFLRPGDRIEVEIDGLGLLSNPVVAES
jgi:2-keto-4-pentenoate hydratase/2-oxohepta-3-ene-1,7-dioic acid hydratase in catechol pathway